MVTKNIYRSLVPYKVSLVSILGLLLLVASQSVLTIESRFSEDNDEEYILQVNSAAKVRLGVGIISLAFLVEVKKGTWFLEESLASEGRSFVLTELETAGLAKVTRVYNREGRFVRLDLSERGESIARALRASK